MILGTDCTPLLAAMQPDIIGTQPWQPIVRKTKLGLMPMGVFCPFIRPVDGKNASFGVVTDPIEQSNLHEMMKTVFGVEDQQTENYLWEAKPVKRLTPKQEGAVKKVLLTLAGNKQSGYCSITLERFLKPTYE